MKSPHAIFKEELTAICSRYQGNPIKGGHFFRVITFKKPVHFDVCNTVKTALTTITNDELPALAIAFQDYLADMNSDKLAKKIGPSITKYVLDPQTHKNTPDYLKFQTLLKGMKLTEQAVVEPISMKANVLLVGDSGVGKSMLYQRFTNPDFKFSEKHVETIGVDFQSKLVELDGGDSVKLLIHDCGGQERNKSVVETCYPKSNAVIICIDVTSQASFKSAGTYLEKIREKQPGAAIALAITKSDKDHAIDELTIQQLASGNGVNYCYWVSALTEDVEQSNVKKLFESVAKGLLAAQKAINEAAKVAASSMTNGHK